MTPEQRTTAKRLAKQLDFLSQPFAHNAADLLRELLAEPRGEPVAWQLLGSDSFLSAAAKMHHGARAAAYDVPLYTHPPLQRKPLDATAVQELKLAVSGKPYLTVEQLVRQVERAHGITGEPT